MSGKSTEQKLEGQVAAVLNEREVAINLGFGDGVADGMKFAIMSKEPVAIVDPSTSERLGELDRPKARVKVSEVHEKFSIARTYETYEVNVGGQGIDLRSFGGIFSAPPKWVTRVKTLRVAESDLPVELSPEESIVNIGDRVVGLDLGDSMAEDGDDSSS